VKRTGDNSTAERRFSKYLDSLGDALGHTDRVAPLRAYTTGLLLPGDRKSVEPIALNAGEPPRTLQEFLSQHRWDQDLLRDDLQGVVRDEHAGSHPVGIFDETSDVKQGDKTPGVQRQWCGSVGKTENCIVTVHLAYARDGFHALLDGELFLPEPWSDDRDRCREAGIPDDLVYRPKWKIGLELYDRATGNGLHFDWLTFDEGYGRDSAFLDGLEQRRQVFVGEVPTNFHGWVIQPRVLRGPAQRRGRKKKYPRLARGRPSSAVQNLVRFSPVFRTQKWQRYRIKDTERGPEVWEVKWAVFWRKGSNDLPGRRHCLIVAHNVLTHEVKYFVSNRMPGEPGITLRRLLRVAFQRWSVESCFRQAKEELGLDHYEVRGWRCVHRHFYLTQLSHLFCARIRQKFDAATTRDDPLEHLTTEQVRRAMNVWLEAAAAQLTKAERFERELAKQQYYQGRNAQARRSHTKNAKGQTESPRH